jgi:hypothetical protein
MLMTGHEIEAHFGENAACAVAQFQKRPTPSLEQRLQDAGLNLSTIVLSAVDRALAENNGAAAQIRARTEQITGELLGQFESLGLYSPADTDRAASEEVIRARVIGFLAHREVPIRDERTPEAMLALAIAHAMTAETRARLRNFSEQQARPAA